MVQIITTPPTPPDGFVMPSDADLRRLQDIVYRLRPGLDLREDPDFRNLDHHREFLLAFRAIAMMGRTAEVDHGKAISYWASYARNLLQDCGVNAEVPGNIVLAAALAHGDVAHARNALGLTWASSGRPASDAWRGVLARGALRPPSPEQVMREMRGPRVIDMAPGAHDVQIGFIGSTIR